MAEARQSILPLNPLLFWQVCFLCFTSGILSLVWFVEALVFFAIIIILDSRFYPLNFQLLSFDFSIYPAPESRACTNQHGNNQADLLNSESNNIKLFFSAYALKHFIGALHYNYLKIITFIRVNKHTTIIHADFLLVCIRLGLAICSFILGFAIAYYAMPTPLNMPLNAPAWTVNDSGRAKYIRWQGVVERVQYLPDNRLRIVFNKVQPIDNAIQNKALPKKVKARTINKLGVDSHDNSANTMEKEAKFKALAVENNILQGKLMWTWENAPAEPLVGEVWEISSKIHKIQSFMNFGLSNISFIYHAQAIFWRAYTFKNKGNPEKALNSPSADRQALTRYNLQDKFFLALESSERWGRSKDALEDKQDHLKNDGNSNNSASAYIQNLSQAQAALPALLFGDRRALSNENFNLLARASLIHSLAISGQHLAVTALFASLIVFVISYIYPNMFLFLPRTKYIILLALPLAAIYLWLGGAPSSLQRATCMMFLAAFFLLGNKSIIAIDILIIAILSLVILWPFSIFELGLQLSALCVATIILVSPLLRKLSYSHKYKAVQKNSISSFFTVVLQIAIISLAIQIAMAPYLLLIFGSVSPWFFLNVIWLPILGIFVLPLTVLALVLLFFNLTFAASIALKFASLPCEYLFNFLSYLDKIGLLKDHIFLRPHWLALLGFALLLIALAMTFARNIVPKSSNRFVIIGVILICVAVFLRHTDTLSSRVKITMLDVGQGQAILIDAYGGEKVLIDGGGSFSTRFDMGRSIVSKVLTYNNKPYVDYIINSHAHIDHFKGLLYITEYFGFDSYLYSTLPEKEEYFSALIKHTEGKTLKELICGDKIILAEKPHKLILEVVYPLEKHVPISKNKDYSYGKKRISQNNSSLILRLVEESMDNKGNITRHGLALIMGDLEDQGIKHLLSLNSNLQADVLVVPHHGSKNSYNVDLYKAVKPKVALISYSISNNFGFPGLNVVNALKNAKADVYTTGLHGSVEVILKDGKYKVKTKKGELEKNYKEIILKGLSFIKF